MKGKKTGTVAKTEKTKNEKTKLIMGIAMMVFAVAIAGGTYAYYQTTISGTISGTILAWDCVDGSTTSQLALGNLKPGSSGSFKVKAYSTNFKFNVAITFLSGTNVPAKFKLYKDSAHTSASVITYGSTAFSDSNIAKGTGGKEYTVYYYWVNDAAETPLATGTANKTMTIPYTITCTQATSQ